jgi:hypothetical protein
MPSQVPRTTNDYLALRLDGARDLYLLALALGERQGGPHTFGPMIQEARIHFAGVIEEARIAGLDAGTIADMLGKKMSKELADNIRPEIVQRLEEMLKEKPLKKKRR